MLINSNIHFRNDSDNSRSIRSKIGEQDRLARSEIKGIESDES